MSRDLLAIPAPGIRRLNGVGGAGTDVDLTSIDGSIAITPDPIARTVDLSATGAGELVLRNVPCDVSVYIGSFVRIDSSGIAWNAQADIFSNSHVLGLVELKPTSTTCDILCFGLSSLVFVGLDPTLNYYLSDVTAGAMQTNIPIGSGKVMVKVGQPILDTTFVVRIDQQIRRN